MHALPHPTAPTAAFEAGTLPALLRRHAVAFGIFSTAITALLLVPTLYMLQVYDRVLSSRNESTLLVLTVMVLGLYGVLVALEGVRNAVCARIAARADTLLAPAVFDAALRPGAAAPQLLSADLAAVRQALGGPLPALVFDVPLSLVFVAAAFVVDAVLGAFVSGAIVLLLALATWQELRLRRVLAHAQQDAAQAAHALAEAARQAPTVRALGMQSALAARWQALNARAAACQLAAGADSGRTAAALRFARLALQSLALAVGAWLVLENRITPGMMIATSVLLGRALTPWEGLIHQGRQLAALRERWTRLQALLARPPAATPVALPAARGALSAESLVLRAPGADDGRAPLLLQGVSFELAAGQVLGIVGASGAGKSTLAQVLCGALPATAGSVRLDGAELQQWPDAQRAAAMGVLPQDVHFFDGTVAENIARMGTVGDAVDDERGAAVVRAAQRAGAHELILRLPQGYQTRLGSGGVTLSGGQRQRIGLARALYGDPALLILDEPNAHLDEQGEHALHQALVAHRAAGGSAVVVTHRASLLQVADQLLVLHAGRVAVSGPRDTVMRQIHPTAVARSA